MSVPVRRHPNCAIHECKVCLEDHEALDKYFNDQLGKGKVDWLGEYRTWLKESSIPFEINGWASVEAFAPENINSFVEKMNVSKVEEEAKVEKVTAVSDEEEVDVEEAAPVEVPKDIVICSGASKCTMDKCIHKVDHERYSAAVGSIIKDDQFSGPIIMVDKEKLSIVLEKVFVHMPMKTLSVYQNCQRKKRPLNE